MDEVIEEEEKEDEGFEIEDESNKNVLSFKVEKENNNTMNENTQA